MYSYVFFLFGYVASADAALTSTACVSTMMRAPSNAEEIFTSVDFASDSLIQMFICRVGYQLQISTIDNGEVMLHRKCKKGIWSPSKPVDCVRKLSCGGLWFTRRLEDGTHQCYLITRAKSWEQSRRMCWALGAELLTIQDQEEEEWLRKHIPRMNSLLPEKFREDIQEGDDSFIWLGLSNFKDGESWRWVDEGDEANYTHWADNQPINDGWSHFSYIDTQNNWAWHQSTNENNAIKESLFKICEKEADDLQSSMSPVRMGRIFLIQENSPFTFIIRGLGKLISTYLRYVWGPIFMNSLYSRLTSSNYVRILDNIMSGNGRAVDSFVNISAVHDYQLLRTNQRIPGETTHRYKCSENYQNAVDCGYRFDEARGVKDFALYMNITRSMSQFYSTAYKLKLPLVGITEEFYVFNIETGTSVTSWSAWLDCECDIETRSTVSRRFRLCLSIIYPQSYKLPCRGLESPAEYQIRSCPNDICEGSVLDWSEWTSCDAQCGPGHRSRYKLCSGESWSCGDNLGRVYEYTVCEASCEFGAVASVDIEAWIRNDPQLAHELEGFEGLKTDHRVQNSAQQTAQYMESLYTVFAAYILLTESTRW